MTSMNALHKVTYYQQDMIFCREQKSVCKEKGDARELRIRVLTAGILYDIKAGLH